MELSQARFRVNRRIAVAAAAALAVVVGSTLPAYAAPAAPSTVSPIADRSSTGVTADALPTVQIDGVVWSQAIVGNTVYAGGDFANARPAGAAPGANLTPRTDLLAYNLTTGALITAFAPVLNGEVKSVVASPDGSRVYVGGSFTTVNGVAHYRMAAFDTATGQLINSFVPVVDTTVNSLAVTNTTVYAGGIFSKSNATPRSRLAAFSATSGALLGWNPTADSVVDALQLTPDGKHVIVGGGFANVDGARALGLASLDATTGAMVPFAANQVVKDYGSQGSILSLSTDGTAIYGTGYAYGNPSNFEGVFSADPNTGAINWLADCHGDSYGSYPSGGQVYVVSHEHFCANIGGFPDTNPRSRWSRTSAFTTQATGTVATNGQSGAGYGNFGGQPSPSLVNWFPDLEAGTYTHQSQAAWTVTGNGNYVVEGGEFPNVNGTAQQGLVRFAVPSIAPDKRGPMDTAASTSTPTATAASETSVTVSWPANWDQDNDSLTYRLFRNGTQVDQTTAVSQFWNRPTLTFTDSSLLPGTTYKYTVYTSDPDGNTVRTAPATVTTPGSPPAPTTTTLTTSPATPVAGQPVTATAAVRSADGPADGDVSIAVDGGAAQPVALQDGAATLSVGALHCGTHSVVANYAGDAYFGASTQTQSVTVGRDATAVATAISPTTPVTGQRLSVRTSVRTSAPGTSAATGTVTVSVDGKAAKPTTLGGAAATTTLPGLPAGRHTVSLRYNGDSDHNASTVSRVVTVAAGRSIAHVTSSAPRTSARKVVHFRATVKVVAPATGRPTGTVVFYVDGHRRASRTLRAGVATWSVRLPKGKHRVTTRYAGSSSYRAATSNVVRQTER